MQTITGNLDSRERISRRMCNLRRLISWRALPVLMVLSLLISMIGLTLPTPALAAHEGEETAGFLPSDTDLYLTINLSPGLDQLIQFGSLFNYWWQDSDFQDDIEGLLTEFDTESGINIEDDVLPWLGPEIAVGIKNITAGAYEGYGEDESGLTERDNVQLAVVAAMAEVPVGVLDSAGTIDSTACTVTYDGGTPLPVGDYIIGGIASIRYSYSVAADGLVEATSGPIVEDETGTPEEPEFVIFIGTSDKEASDAAFEKYKAWRIGDGWAFCSTTYRGYSIEIGEDCDQEYYGFTNEYILFSNSEEAIHDSIDLMLDGGDSLADSANFQAAQAALPDRVGMLYCNTEQLWEEVITGITDTEPECILEFFDDMTPPYFAASFSLTGNGMSMSVYCPLPDGAILPSTEPDLLQSTQIVPGDAIFFTSVQDVNAYWEQIGSLIDDNWECLMQDAELPSDINSFDDIINLFNIEYDVDIDEDIFGWMTGECSVALLSLPAIPEDGEDESALIERDNVQLAVVAAMCGVPIGGLDSDGTIDSTACTVTYDGGTPLPVGDYIVGGIASLSYPYSIEIDGEVNATSGPAVEGDGDEYGEQTDILIMFEVENTSAVGDSLNTLIEGINDAMGDMGVSDLLETSDTTIDGVNATLVTNDEVTESGASPGWLFLDVDSTHYLVIGTTTEALIGAVDASQDDIPSLDEAEEYQGVQSLLPETGSSFGYLDIAQIFDLAVPQILAGEMSENESDVIDLIISYPPSQCAVGYTCTLDDSEGVAVTGALYLLPPALVEQSIDVGTTGTIDIPEQIFNDPDLGQCAVSVDVDIDDAPDGASIELVAVNDISEDITSGFALAAEDAGLSIEDVAYVIRVDKTNLTNENIGAATITMKVSKTWADDYGTGNVKIIRISDGTQEALPTTFIGYEGDYAVFEGVSENGLSYFGLTAMSSTGGTNWALIGGIIGAALFVIIVLAIVMLIRRTAA